MGSALSTSKRPRFIIGDLSRSTYAENKVFSLSHAVVNLEHPIIDYFDPRLGIKILDIKENGLESNDINLEIDGSNGTHDDKALVSKQAGTDPSNCIALHDQSSSKSLFSVLVTDKPFYYSQSFTQWKSYHSFATLYSCCSPEKTSIYIVQVDNFPGFIRDYEIKLASYKHCLTFSTLLQTFAEAFFDGAEIRTLPTVNLMESKWNIKTRIHSVTKQKQYYVRDFYMKLKKLMPVDGLCIMGYSWTDLYPNEDLNFVLGEANTLSKSGIFCFGRYEPKTFNPETHKDITEINTKLMWRILKVFSHELCHLFAMQHCWYFACAMNESTSMAEAFSQPLFLCPVCLRKLQYVLKFDIVHRYQKLLQFLTDLSVHYPCEEFNNAVTWLKHIIKYLKSEGT